MKSAFYFLETKVVGQMVAGLGQINNIKASTTQVETTIVCITTSQNSPDVDQFWKLELTGIKEEPDAADDDEALTPFKQNINKHNRRY